MNPSGKRHKHPLLVRASWSEDITAPIHGLVLAGGHSKRMGVDKGALDYHGKPHREYTADQVAKFSTKTFLSCRSEQQGEIETMYETIPDTFVGDDVGVSGELMWGNPTAIPLDNLVVIDGATSALPLMDSLPFSIQPQ